jgi:hypothetical protein
VRSEKGGTERVECCTFLYGQGNGDDQLGTGVFLYKITSAVRRVQFISDKMSYVILRGRWCSIILNRHAPCEGKSDGVKDSFYEEIGGVFEQFLRYDMISMRK